MKAIKNFPQHQMKNHSNLIIVSAIKEIWSFNSTQDLIVHLVNKIWGYIKITPSGW